MKKRFTEDQMIKTVGRLDGGEEIKSVARDLGVSPQTLSNWKKKYSGINVNEARRLRTLEAENGKLKKLVADLSLDNLMLKEVNAKNW